MCAFSPFYWRRQTITWGRYLNPGGGWKSDEGSVFWNLGFLSFWNLELYDFHNIVRLSDINNKKLITHDNLSILNLKLTWHQLLYSSLSNCGVTHCTTQAFSVDCLLYATLLYKRECLSYFIHLQHQSLHFRLLLDLVSGSETSEAQIHCLIIWSQRAVTLVIMGLGHGIGYISTECSSFKDWTLQYLCVHRLPIMPELIRCCEVLFEKICHWIWIFIFKQLSVSYEQTGDYNCFPNCLFEQWPTQLVLRLCFSHYHCLTVATYLYEFFKLTLAFNYICICNMSASMIS